jgi:hypothetical protein
MAQKSFIIAATYPHGIIAPEASLQHGNKILRLSTAYPYFGKSELWKAHERPLQNARPVSTRAHAGLFRLPLGEIIITDGKRSFIVDESGELTWKLQVANKFLKPRILKKPGLYVVERGVTTFKEGKDEYTSLVGEANDARIGKIPSNGLAKTTDHPHLFDKDVGSLDVHLRTPASDVKVGLISVGDSNEANGTLSNGSRLGVVIPDDSTLKLGVLLKVSVADKLLEQVEEFSKRVAAGGAVTEKDQKLLETIVNHFKAQAEKE